MQTVLPESTLRRKSVGFLKSQNTPDARMVFSSGIGINAVEGIPIRFLSYLVPMISAVQAFTNSVGQIYTADRAAIRLGVSSDIVRVNTSVIEKLLDKFIDFFCPQISRRVFFSREKDDSSAEIINLRRKLVSKMIDIILDESDQAIIRFASNRKNGGDIRTPLEYMVSHSLYMRDPVTDDARLFLVQDPPGYTGEKVAMIGGPAEEIFYKVRTQIMRYLGISSENQNIQLFTDIGRLPPYYSRFGEPVVGQGIGYSDVKSFLENLDIQLRYDYLMLIVSCASTPDFGLTKKRIEDLSQPEWVILADGFERLQKFLTQL